MTAMPLNEQKLLDLFAAQGALLSGHFLLSSGLHSDKYMQSALVLQHPSVAEELGKGIAAFFPGPVNVVLSPAIGGLIIGQEVARAKNVRAIFAEKDAKGKPVLRRGFRLDQGEKVLVVEDVITTGLSTSEVIDLVVAAGAELVGVGSIVNRMSGGHENLARFGKPVHSLLNLEVKSWKPEACELCKKGTPAVKPGSRKS